MDRVLSVGGIFFKAADPDTLREWYRRHLGIEVESWGGVAFRYDRDRALGREAVVVWSVFPATTKYFEPSGQPFMINYRVADLDALLAVLRSEGCQVSDKAEASDDGKFGWVMDPEGNRCELWEPPKVTA